MPKINHEEYEILKELDDKWKWIARDKDNTLVMGAGKNERYLDGWFPPENVGDSLVVDEINAIKVISEWGNLFQFIQWEDEEPYNIAELIEEYENSPEYVTYISNERTRILSNDLWSKLESEETEVNKQKLIEKWESAIEAAEFYGRGKEDRLIEYMRNFVDDLNRLDEPEVLTSDWISKNVEYAYFDMLDGSGRLSSATAIIKPEKLKKLLVPKQEELEVKIQELIEVYKQEDGAYSNPENGWISGFIEDLKNLLEEEQKYYVVDNEYIPLLQKGHGYVNRARTGLSIFEKGRDNDQFALTEQEIKDYDERFWPFAVKVEELEE